MAMSPEVGEGCPRLYRASSNCFCISLTEKIATLGPTLFKRLRRMYCKVCSTGFRPAVKTAQRFWLRNSNVHTSNGVGPKSGDPYGERDRGVHPRSIYTTSFSATPVPLPCHAATLPRGCAILLWAWWLVGGKRSQIALTA